MLNPIGDWIVNKNLLRYNKSGKCKSNDPDISIFYATYKKDPEWVKGLNQSLKDAGLQYSGLNSSYIVWTPGQDIRIVSPNYYHYNLTKGEYKDAKGKVVSWIFLKGPYNPNDYIKSCLCFDNAAVFEWPNEKDRFKVRVHNQSYWAKTKYKIKVEDTDGLNRSALKDVKDWIILKNYIECRSEYKKPIQRATICEIVKTISLNILDDELKAEQSLLGMG